MQKDREKPRLCSEKVTEVEIPSPGSIVRVLCVLCVTREGEIWKSAIDNPNIVTKFLCELCAQRDKTRFGSQRLIKVTLTSSQYREMSAKAFNSIN